MKYSPMTEQFTLAEPIYQEVQRLKIKTLSSSPKYRFAGALRLTPPIYRP